MSGRKRTKVGKIAGNSPAERVKTWYTHFKNLLGTQQAEEEAEEEITAVSDNPQNPRWALHRSRACQSKIHSERGKKCRTGRHTPRSLQILQP